jgi:predicted secreted protein
MAPARGAAAGPRDGGIDCERVTGGRKMAGGVGTIMTRILLSAAALCLFAWSAAANDQALIDFVGYSGDFRYFAFEEYGVQDGSGSAYSSIHILDLWTDAETPGSPFEAAGHEDDKTLAEIRHEAEDAAGADLRKLRIDTPVQIAALLGDGLTDKGTEMHFGFPSGSPGATQGDYTLVLDSFDLAPTSACTEAIGKPGLGYSLSVKSEGAAREAYRDTIIAAWRGCSTAYRLYAVVFPYGDAEIANAVAIVAFYPPGWEGEDRRFVAAAIGTAPR